VEIEGRDGLSRVLLDTLVDPGSFFTWIPRHILEELGVTPKRKQGFMVADGRSIERDIGYALVRAGGSEAPDLVVFAEPGDMTLLGAHSLEGLNLRVDPVRKALIPAGPIIAAAAA
jgi:predicted aspartyl protease